MNYSVALQLQHRRYCSKLLTANDIELHLLHSIEDSCDPDDLFDNIWTDSDIEEMFVRNYTCRHAVYTRLSCNQHYLSTLALARIFLFLHGLAEAFITCFFVVFLKLFTFIS